MTRKQLQRAIAQGAPVVRRGGKGRGHSTLLDPSAVADWLNRRGTFTQEHHLQLARGLIAAVAEATALRFRAASGPHKLALARELVAQFFDAAQAIREQLGLPPLEPADVPAEIRKMARVGDIFGR